MEAGRDVGEAYWRCSRCSGCGGSVVEEWWRRGKDVIEIIILNYLNLDLVCLYLIVSIFAWFLY